MKKYIYIIMLLFVFFNACKEDFLDFKSDKSLMIPSSLTDFQAILDAATSTMNGSSCHELGIIGADEYAVASSIWELLPASVIYQKNAYIWLKGDIYGGNEGTDWNRAYHRVFYANTAIEGITKISPQSSEQEAWNNVKGSALFYRAMNFYQLSQLFCKVYNPQTAGSDLGIPLRLEPDINIKSKRATLSQTYEQVLSDLKIAAALLPVIPKVKYRPSKPAVYALLARIYLQMENYEQARFFSDLCLRLKSELLDYNGLNKSQNYSFPAIDNNPEVIFCTYTDNMPITGPQRASMAADLLSAYQANDLRYFLYYRNFSGRIIFKGSYTGNGGFFTGIAVNEVLLTRAESLVRLNRIEEAASDMNALMSKRYDKNFNGPAIPNTQEALLDFILSERRKELVLRGTRWEDLRRLNKEARFAKTLIRVLSGKTFELSPNDSRYVWPIPNNVIQLSGIEQNER